MAYAVHDKDAVGHASVDIRQMVHNSLGSLARSADWLGRSVSAAMNRFSVSRLQDCWQSRSSVVEGFAISRKKKWLNRTVLPLSGRSMAISTGLSGE